MAKARSSKAKPRTKPETPGPYIAASVTQSEATPRRYATVRDAQMVARAVCGTLWWAVTLNASICAAQKMRLYRPAGSSKVWRGRGVPKHRKAWLYGEHRSGLNPGHKAVEFSEWAGDVEEVTEHPVLDLLRRPDPWMTGSDWWFLHYWFKEGPGKSYVWTGERTEGVPTSLYHLFPSFVRVQPHRREFIAGYWYGRATTDEMWVPVDEVMYCRQYTNPTNPTDAISWPVSVVLETDNENAALSAEIARWNNGGNPGMVIKVDPNTTDQQLAQAEAGLAQKIRGIQKSGTPLLLRKAEVVQYGSKPHEMAYKDGMSVVRDRIRAAAGIPEAMEKMGSASLANAYRADPQYMGQTILPRTCKVAEECNELLKFWGVEAGEMWFACDNPVAEDEKAIEDSSRQDVAGGIVTANEARAMRGLDPADDPAADVLCFQGVPLSVKATPAPAFPPFGPGKGGDDEEAEADERPADGSDAGDAGDGGGVDDRKAAAPAEARGLEPPQTKATVPGLPSELDAQLNRLERQVLRWLKATYPEALQPNGSIDIAGRMPELEAIIARALPKIIQGAANDALDKIGFDLDFSLSQTPETLEWLRDRGTELVTSVSGTVRDRVRVFVEQGTAEGLSLDQIRAGIENEAPSLSAYQAERIARTETSFAANHGILEAGKSVGATGKRWMVAGGPCPECEAIAAANPNPIPLTADFEPGLAMPPKHPGCRCLIDLVMEPEP